MDGSSILTLLLGVAIGAYFHESVERAVPILKNESQDSAVAEA